MTLLHAALNVSDVEESIAFYRDLLGMEPVDELDDDIRQVWIGRDGAAALQLRGGHDGPIGPAGVHHVAIDVENVEETAAQVEADRIRREPAVVESLGIRTAFVTDPDGYTVELIEDIQ